jgi:orotate phosphoribosyltransferase
MVLLALMVLVAQVVLAVLLVVRVLKEQAVQVEQVVLVVQRHQRLRPHIKQQQVVFVLVVKVTQRVVDILIYYRVVQI